MMMMVMMVIVRCGVEKSKCFERFQGKQLGRGEGFEVSGHGCAYQEVAEEDHDCDFADRGDVDGGVFFDLWCEVL